MLRIEVGPDGLGAGGTDGFRAIEDVVPGMQVYTIWSSWATVVSVNSIEDGQLTWLLFEDGTSTEDRNGEVYEVRWEIDGVGD